MKTIKAICTMTVLVLSLSVSAYAGEISSPGITTHSGEISSPGITATTAPGEIGTPGVTDEITSESVTDFFWMLLALIP
jgi:hypothetical protein